MLLEQLASRPATICRAKTSSSNRRASSGLPTVLPGIKINTSETVNQAYTQMQMQRWTGTNWDQFGEVMKAD